MESQCVFESDTFIHFVLLSTDIASSALFYSVQVKSIECKSTGQHDRTTKVSVTHGI